jgi:hypothetical protein
MKFLAHWVYHTWNNFKISEERRVGKECQW